MEKLLRFGISTVIDVRELPISRKPGFSKSKLSQFLEQFNIKYIHYKELGSPKRLREKLYKDTDYEGFFNEFEEYLKTQSGAVESLYWDTIVHEISCLMCLEQEPSVCHRKIVAKKIKEIDNNGMVIKHI